jgi:hypothetical protein
VIKTRHTQDQDSNILTPIGRVDHAGETKLPECVFPSVRTLIGSRHGFYDVISPTKFARYISSRGAGVSLPEIGASRRKVIGLIVAYILCSSGQHRDRKEEVCNVLRDKTTDT